MLAWGSNTKRQTILPVLTDVKVIAVSAGLYHSLAITKDFISIAVEEIRTRASHESVAVLNDNILQIAEEVEQLKQSVRAGGESLAIDEPHHRSGVERVERLAPDGARDAGVTRSADDGGNSWFRGEPGGKRVLTGAAAQNENSQDAKA